MAVYSTSDVPWQTYRDVRLRALRTDPAAFGSHAEREEALAEEEWARRALARQTFVWVHAEDEPKPTSAVAPRAGGIAGLAPASVYLEEGSAHEFSCTPEELAFVVSVWVEPGRRGRGVFDELFTALIDAARREGYSTLALHVRQDNPRAAAAYRRYGFTKVHTPSCECPAGEDEYILRLNG